MITYPTNKLQKVLLGGGCEQRNLPSGYTELEYLQSSGTQWIDTGYKPNANTAINIKYYPAVSSTFMCLYGVQDSKTSKRFYGLISATQFKVQINSNAGGTESYWGLNKNGTFSKNSNGTFAETQCIVDLTVDNVNKNVSIKSDEYNGDISLSGTEFGDNLNCTNNMLLLSRSTAGTAGNSFSGRIYVFSIKDNGVLIQNLIPARRNSDNVLGMYDTVTGTFFTNAGTGTFTAGADVVPTPDKPVDIRCNNGVLKHGVSIINWNNVVDNYTINGTTGHAVSTTITRCYLDYFQINIGDIIRTYSTNINERGSSLIQYASNTESSFVESVAFTAINGYKYAVATTNGYARLVYLNNKDVAIQNNWAVTKNQPLGIYADGIQEVVTDNLGNTANAEMLLAVGDYKDTQSVLDGKVTRSVGIKVLDGTEEWEKNSIRINTYIVPYTTLPSLKVINPLISSHFRGTTEASDLNTDGYIYLGKSLNLSVSTSICTDINTFKQYLADQYAAGTPIIIVYPLAEPTTEQVTPQPLAGSSATVTAGSIYNLPIVTDNITKLKSRFITDANGEVQEVKRVYIGDNLVYSAEIEEQS